jgi:hypothetical protein
VRGEAPQQSTATFMWRIFIGLCAIVFSVVTVTSVLLLGMLLVDGEYRDSGRVAMGIALFAWMAWTSSREWQRERQKREFQRENSRET